MNLKYWSSSIAILLMVWSGQTVLGQTEVQAQSDTEVAKVVPVEAGAELHLSALLQDGVLRIVARDVRAGLQLQQQIQQFSVTMQSLSRQLESLEKLENTTLSTELPTKAKLHAAAEAFGQAAKEHLQALKEASESIAKPSVVALSQLESLAKLHNAVDETTYPNVIVRPTYDIPPTYLRPDVIQTELLQALIRAQSAQQKSESPLATHQAQREVMAIERLMAEKAKLAAKSDELREQIQGEVARVKSADEETRAAAATRIMKDLFSVQKQEQATDNATAQRMEKLESRLERIEALLERLAGEKSGDDQQDDQ
ncbi:MAG: hypothetical protein Q8M16_00330 [Pirellulaceae bacterium]|nr:hypothetical protein [Pirellulaceae bacterium]